MARTAKTNHVMSLVGSKSGRDSAGVGKKPEKRKEIPAKAVNPAIFPNGAGQIKEKEIPSASDEANAHVPDNTDNEKNLLPKGETEPSSESAGNPELSTETGRSGKSGITAIVPELINQELEAIVERFKIDPTDSNLWQLTKTALETIRPEFSVNGEEYAEKCDRLRQKVILEMTKAAIRLSKAHRENK